MRKTILLCVALLMTASAAMAQGKFIPDKTKRERRAEIRKLCENLLAEENTQKRTETRKKIIELDVIADDQGQPLDDGFAAAPLGWLYKEARETRPDLNARLQALLALGALSSTSANPHILAALDDPNAAIQLLAIYTVEHKKLTQAIPQLQAMLNSSNTEVQTAAASALANMGANGDSAKVMVRQMQAALASLKDATDTAKREEFERVIEVMGRSVARIVKEVNWMPGATIEELEKAVDAVAKAVNG